MLYLTRKLDLHMTTGDRIEITVVETQDGGVSLGISAPQSRKLRKAIVEDDLPIVAKQLGRRGTGNPPESESLRRRAR